MGRVPSGQGLVDKSIDLQALWASMSLTAPVISNASFGMTLQLPALSGLSLQPPEKLTIPLAVGTMTFLKQIAGTYTPANDTQVIYQFLATENPSFMIFACDGHSNLNLFDGSNNFLNGLSVTKLALISLVTPSGAKYSQVTLVGLAGAPNPMSQGVPVDWQLWVGDGVIT